MVQQPSELWSNFCSETLLWLQSTTACQTAVCVELHLLQKVVHTLFMIQEGPKLLEEALIVWGLDKDPRRSARCFSFRNDHLLRVSQGSDEQCQIKSLQLDKCGDAKLFPYIDACIFGPCVLWRRQQHHCLQLFCCSSRNHCC